MLFRNKNKILIFCLSIIFMYASSTNADTITKILTKSLDIKNSQILKLLGPHKVKSELEVKIYKNKKLLSKTKKNEFLFQKSGGDFRLIKKNLVDKSVFDAVVKGKKAHIKKTYFDNSGRKKVEKKQAEKVREFEFMRDRFSREYMEFLERYDKYMQFSTIKKSTFQNRKIYIVEGGLLKKYQYAQLEPDSKIVRASAKIYIDSSTLAVLYFEMKILSKKEKEKTSLLNSMSYVFTRYDIGKKITLSF